MVEMTANNDIVNMAMGVENDFMCESMRIAFRTFKNVPADITDKKK